MLTSTIVNVIGFVGTLGTLGYVSSKISNINYKKNKISKKKNSPVIKKEEKMKTKPEQRAIEQLDDISKDNINSPYCLDINRKDIKPSNERMQLWENKSFDSKQEFRDKIIAIDIKENVCLYIVKERDMRWKDEDLWDAMTPEQKEQHRNAQDRKKMSISNLIYNFGKTDRQWRIDSHDTYGLKRMSIWSLIGVTGLGGITYMFKSKTNEPVSNKNQDQEKLAVK